MYICDEMTAIFAHEVKNPISLIKANIELLELDKKENGYEKNLAVMKREIDKINNIITDLVIFSSPTQKNELSKINILDIIEQNIEDIVISGAGGDIKFFVNCFCNLDCINIFARADKIDIVIHNIYKNSIEAMQGKKGSIYTKIYKKANNTVIDIIDEGGGIDDDMKDKIYKPFATNKDGGSGLGVCICRRVLEEIGGRMTLFNNENKGCTARLIFS